MFNYLLQSVFTLLDNTVETDFNDSKSMKFTTTAHSTFAQYSNSMTDPVIALCSYLHRYNIAMIMKFDMKELYSCVRTFLVRSCS